MSHRKTPSSSRLIIAAIAAAGIAGGYFYFRGTFAAGTNPRESAKVIPDEAVMAAYLVHDSRRWSKFEQLGSPGAQAAIAQSIQHIKTELLTENNLDYQKDLKPWVGDVMVALIPASNETETAVNPEPNLLMVVGIKNKLRAWLFARNLKSQEGIKQQEFQYKGVTVSEILPPENEPLYQATLNNHLILSPNRRIVERAIDTFKGEPSLATQLEVAKPISKGADVDNAIAHFYMPDYSSGMQTLWESFPDKSTLPSQVKAVKSVVMSAGVDNAGLRVRAIVRVDPEFFPQEQPVSGTVLKRFPAETIALISGQGLGRSWSTLIEQSQTQPSLQEFVTIVRQTLAAVNLNADRDVFSWMDGEFGVGIISSNQGLLGQLGFGGALVFETRDRATAEATRTKLDAIARNLVPFPINIESRNVNGVEVREWKIPLQGALVGHGWLDENSVFIAFGAPVVDAIANQPTTILTNGPHFQAIAGSLPTPNQGYFYLDMDRTMSIINAMPLLMGQQMAPETNAVLNSIRGIGVTAVWADPSTSEIEMLFALKKTKEFNSNE